MFRQRVSHPLSINFEEEDFETPSFKRLKRLDSTRSYFSLRSSDDDESTSPPPIQASSREIPGSGTESNNAEPSLSSSQKTELENALPPIKTDEEAVAEYEAARVAETEGLDLRGRLGQRKWVQGKSSIYVDAFNLALETVLEDESHLFDAAEMSVFEEWRKLGYEAQYL